MTRSSSIGNHSQIQQTSSFSRTALSAMSGFWKTVRKVATFGILALLSSAMPGEATQIHRVRGCEDFNHFPLNSGDRIYDAETSGENCVVNIASQDLKGDYYPFVLGATVPLTGMCFLVTATREDMNDKFPKAAKAFKKEHNNPSEETKPARIFLGPVLSTESGEEIQLSQEIQTCENYKDLPSRSGYLIKNPETLPHKMCKFDLVDPQGKPFVDRVITPRAEMCRYLLASKQEMNQIFPPNERHSARAQEL